MHFPRVNGVNVIHDVITKAEQFPYTARFVFVGFRNNKTQQIRRCSKSKISNLVGRNDNFLAKARKLSILPIFSIYARENVSTYGLGVHILGASCIYSNTSS